MQIHIYQDADTIGKQAAADAAAWVNACIQEKGRARIVLSTGASQFPFFEHFVQQPIDWAAVEMFHLDEYIGLSDSHVASFRKYLKERFTSRVPLGKAHFVDGDSGDVALSLSRLEQLIAEAPLDLGLIGIGENAHIAFNDPPADFSARTAYRVVDLDDDCKAQQVREGWFRDLDDVPKQAISMTVRGIMSCSKIISVVPHEVKANAIKRTLESDLTNLIPATMLKTHANWSLYLDHASASLLPIRLATATKTV
ncbi:glucosamine-6-phosphate deaminase [Paenibacillus chungangensis]|uniref:Glucosamine-6-phosphate deaminase n=1 Tax=Paenibacillus chungangensis TaxID=696535 RepID=A0ABW3HU72_9BACL